MNRNDKPETVRRADLSKPPMHIRHDRHSLPKILLPSLGLTSSLLASAWNLGWV